MPLTLAGYTLPLESINEECVAVSTENDKWDSILKKFVHVVNVFGKTYVWTFACVENNVAWASSLVPIFKAAQDAILVLASDLAQRSISDVTVKIVNVYVSASNDGELTARRFTVTVQQVT
jgi:hypothetical protein